MKKLILIFSILIFSNTFGQKDNEKWKSERENEISANEKLIKSMKQFGEKFVVAREVFHWIYFKSEDDREAYIKEVEKERFIIVSTEGAKGEFSLGLQIKRVDKVDKKSVNRYTLFLWELAKKHNGDYDGWETSVEK